MQLSLAGQDGAGLVAGSPNGGHLGRGVAKDENIVGAHVLLQLDIGAVKGADGQGAVERKLHVAGSRRLGAGGGNLLGQVGRRDDELGQTNAVVRDKHHLEQVSHPGVGIDGFGHVIDQLDDQLGHVVGRGRLAGKNHHPWHRDCAGLLEQAQVACDHMQHIEQLALVLVNAFDLHIKQRPGGHADGHVLLQPTGQPLLVGQLGLADGGNQGRVVQVGLERLQAAQVTAPAAADAGIQHGREGRVGLGQPAPRCDAVGLVVEALGPEPGKVSKDRLLHQLRVQRRHPVDRVAGQHRQVGHAHAALATLVDQRDPSHQLLVSPLLLGQLPQKVGIDVKNDLQVARQHPAEHLYRPGLQRLMHEGVVGVREHALAQTPGVGPGQVVLIEQQAHQLGDGQHRVGVVEVDADLGGKLVKGAVLAQVAAQQVLHAGADKEILLMQTQFAPRRRGVVGVEHARHVF